MERTRTTISLDPEVYEVFRKMSEASGVSVSRCMGDWLADTVDAAQLATSKLIQIRRTPERAHMQYMESLAAQGAAMVRGERIDWSTGEVKRPADASGKRSAEASAGVQAPSSNTGLKSPRKR